VDLKYGPRGEEVIRSIDRVSKPGCRVYKKVDELPRPLQGLGIAVGSTDRVSKPGCRVYKKVDELPRPLQGLGIAVVSTSKGVLSDRRCREEKVGGELVAIVS
jgi:ribosomal protein S8